MSLTCRHMWGHNMCHMWDTRHPHVHAGPHMCLTCEQFSSRVGKRVKLEQNMWDTYEHMWATRGSHVDSMWFFYRGSAGWPAPLLLALDITGDVSDWAFDWAVHCVGSHTVFNSWSSPLLKYFPAFNAETESKSQSLIVGLQLYYRLIFATLHSVSASIMIIN